MTDITPTTDITNKNPCCLKCNTVFCFDKFSDITGRWPTDGDMIMCSTCGDLFRCCEGSEVIEASPEFIAAYEQQSAEQMQEFYKIQERLRATYLNKPKE